MVHSLYTLWWMHNTVTFGRQFKAFSWCKRGSLCTMFSLLCWSISNNASSCYYSASLYILIWYNHLITIISMRVHISPWKSSKIVLPHTEYYLDFFSSSFKTEENHSLYLQILFVTKSSIIFEYMQRSLSTIHVLYEYKCFVVQAFWWGNYNVML